MGTKDVNENASRRMACAPEEKIFLVNSNILKNDSELSFIKSNDEIKEENIIIPDRDEAIIDLQTNVIRQSFCTNSNPSVGKLYAEVNFDGMRDQYFSPTTTDEETFPKTDCKFSTPESIEKYFLNGLSPNNKSRDDSKRFECCYCNYRARDAANMRRHIMCKHTFEKPFKCPSCEYRTNDRGNMKRHTRTVHSKIKTLSCPHCKYESGDGGHMKRHIMSLHLKQKPYSCSFCRYSTSYKYALKIHAISKHSIGDKPYKCHHCSYSTIGKVFIRNHVVSKHGTNRPFKCKLCLYSSLSKFYLKNHILTTHFL